MNTNRLFKLRIITVIGLTAIVAILAFTSIANSKASAPAYSGSEDFHRFEAQHPILDVGGLASGQPYKSMEDFHRFEAQHPIIDVSGRASSQPYKSMEDFHRFEDLQESQ